MEDMAKRYESGNLDELYEIDKLFGILIKEP
ncbi:hypothetical protein JOD03_000119 [Chryseomicrobium aureum]|nr:hypothetical protein [Chryseomicrobium aureum]